MRRTYKSKKETGGGLDARDVFLAMDSKKSMFDVFYIQNIKQTKRDMSVGSSMQFAASNKVRKRKYVKRLKEQENIIKDTSSTSAYLTPDKSLRVNKPADLFDQLLMSSPIEHDSKQTVNKFTKFYKPPESKTYCKRQFSKKKMSNSSSDSIDSDKENSNETEDTSDILCHKLEIETENKSNPKYIDESIHNIVKNIALFNESKVNKTPRYSQAIKNIHLTEGIQASPLCSTPFHEKYRGKSIYNFSPITFNLNDSPKVLTVPEINESLEDHRMLKENTLKENLSNLSLHQNNTIHSLQNEVSSPILQNKTNMTIFKKALISKHNVFTENTEPIEISSLQTTELEPFLGFSSVPQVSETEALLDKYKEIENNILINEEPDAVSMNSNLNCSTDDNKDVETNYIENENSMNLNTEENSTTSFDDDNESDYDTCDDEYEENSENSKKQEPIVVVDRLNDSVFQRYYSKMAVCCENNRSLSDISNNDDYASVSESKSSSSNKLSSLTDEEHDYSQSSGEEESEENIENMVSDNNSESDKPEEDTYVSFVTTRRRNGVPNDSFLLHLDSSVTSGSSTDFDKTVLTCRASINRQSQPNIPTVNEIDAPSENNAHQSNMSPQETKPLAQEIDCDITETNLSISRPKNNWRSTRYSNITRASLIPKKKSISQMKSNRKSTIESTVNSTSSLENRVIMTRRSCRLNRDSAQSNLPVNSTENLFIKTDNDNEITENSIGMGNSKMSTCEVNGIVLQPGKRWERSLSIYRRMTTMADHFDVSILDAEPLNIKGRKYRQSVISTMEMQDIKGSLHNESIKSRRSTFVSKPSRSTIKIVRESNASRVSSCSTTLTEDLQGFLTEDCDDTIVELSKLSIADSEHEVTVLENFHETSNRIATARDYVLRRCNQTDVILFDECYPDTVLKNCRKIGEGVYGEVYLWRARDGRARVLKIVPIAGNIKVNGEDQKDYHEIISEIVIAMELSALRAPIAEIEQRFDEGKGVEVLDLHSVMNATDIFNEVLAVRCVQGSYPSRLLDLWELYDETRGSENDNPAVLPADQQFLVLELANAGQDLESYQFTNAEQAYALFKQVAFGLAVAEEAFQFEHRDLHWGNVLIAPTDQKYATFVLRGRAHRVARRGVAATIIDYSLSRVSLPLGARAEDGVALYNDLAADDGLFDAVGDYQFQVYRLMRDKLGNDWKNFEPYTNILWLHYTVDKMITALRYTRTNTKIHKHYISKLKEIKNRILDYGSAVQYVLTDNDL